jgi:hypothetical protein
MHIGKIVREHRTLHGRWSGTDWWGSGTKSWKRDRLNSEVRLDSTGRTQVLTLHNTGTHFHEQTHGSGVTWSYVVQRNCKLWHVTCCGTMSKVTVTVPWGHIEPILKNKIKTQFLHCFFSK